MASGGVAILGAGGHARVVAATLIAAGHEVAGYFDDDPAKAGTYLGDLPILGPIAAAQTYHRASAAVIGIGRNDVRQALARDLDLTWLTVIHPFSWVDPSATIGPGTVVFAGAVVQANARIGSHVILNTRASVDHDAVVGDYVHIAVAHLAGGSSVGEGGFLALGSVVLPYLEVGAWATVGAGAVVTKNVPPGITVVGSPARPVVRQPAATSDASPAAPPEA